MSSSGSGTLWVEDERREFAEGDVLFVAAGAGHRFEDFTDDFAAWAIFCGPPSRRSVGAVLRQAKRSAAVTM